MPLLRTPLSSDPPPHDPPAPPLPAFRALLLLHAGRIGAPHKPRTSEVGAFVRRQVSLLRNAAMAADDDDDDARDGAAPPALRRLEAQAHRLLSLRFDSVDGGAAGTGGGGGAAGDGGGRGHPALGGVACGDARSIGVREARLPMAAAAAAAAAATAAAQPKPAAAVLDDTPSELAAGRLPALFCRVGA